MFRFNETDKNGNSITITRGDFKSESSIKYCECLPRQQTYNRIKELLYKWLLFNKFIFERYKNKFISSVYNLTFSSCCVHKYTKILRNFIKMCNLCLIKILLFIKNIICKLNRILRDITKYNHKDWFITF